LINCYGFYGYKSIRSLTLTLLTTFIIEVEGMPLFYIYGSRTMKKIHPDAPDFRKSTTVEIVDQPTVAASTEPPMSGRLRNPAKVSHVFTILPDVDMESLLCHACENLASLNVMATDLAGDLEGSHRNVTLAIQQLAVLCELLINRALDNLDPPQGLTELSPGNC
jgi:hypothetical protein